MNPNLPDNTIKKAILSKDADLRLLEILKRREIKYFLFSGKLNMLPDEQCHPDLFFHHLGENKLVVEPTVYQMVKDNSFFADIELIKGDTVLSCNYPQNIAYNIARIDQFAFHNIKYTAANICKYFMENNVQMLHVNQGYAKCSVCIVSKHAMITEDKKIAEITRQNGFDTLLINAGEIELSKKHYGFIGGATFKLDSHTLCVNGTLKYHSDYHKILDFLEKHSVCLLEVSENNAKDIGSAIIL